MYKHAGEIGDIWKHLPLCAILKIEQPSRYHETNSAYSGYWITRNPNTEYGTLRVLGLDDNVFGDSEYFRILKMNGIADMRYTGSPGLAMEILAHSARFYFLSPTIVNQYAPYNQ
jgi:23S rRNA (adenine2030-N6)-methyltransferase